MKETTVCKIIFPIVCKQYFKKIDKYKTKCEKIITGCFVLFWGGRAQNVNNTGAVSMTEETKLHCNICCFSNKCEMG